VAVAANGKYVYWARLYCCSFKTQYIGRARHDGSSAQHAFLTIPGTSAAQTGISSVAVDRKHVYWTNGQVIGRASLGGSNVQPTFIDLTGRVSGLGDLQVSDGKLYFRVERFSGGVLRSIGRANSDGTNVVLDFVPGVVQGAGLAVAGSHIYWDQGENVRAIARAGLDGSRVDQHFIDARAGDRPRRRPRLLVDLPQRRDRPGADQRHARRAALRARREARPHTRGCA